MTSSSLNSNSLSSSDEKSELLKLCDLKFRWKKSLALTLDLEDISIAKGRKVFMKGPSGSGKTTLLNLIAGVMTPESGSVEINGTNLATLSGAKRDRFRANHIGFIFQMFNLIPYLSVLENVTLALKFSRERQQRLKQNAEAEARDILNRLGLPDELIRRKVTELSIGQQQRVAAARAIIGNPPLLIADEPTSALDADTRESFIKLLFDESLALQDINKVNA